MMIFSVDLSNNFKWRPKVGVLKIVTSDTVNSVSGP